MSINHKKYTLVIVDEYSGYTWVYFLRKKSQAPEMIMSFIRMVENQNDVKVKQIKTDIGTEFRNHELEIFCLEKRISQTFSSPYIPEQNDVAEKKNKTLIEAAKTMLNGSILSKHFWTDAVRIACYTQNRPIIVKRHDKTSYEIFREVIPYINYFHVFRCHVFVHNHKDHLGKFDAKTDDVYFLGYSSISKAFRVYNTRIQQIEETYHVTFNESMEAIRQYQVDSDVSYYIIPHGRSLTKITQKNHVPEVIAHNEPEIPHTKDTEGRLDLINIEGIHEQNVQNDQMITKPIDTPLGNNTEGPGPITEPLVLDVTQSHIPNQAFTSSYPAPQDRWSRDQHIKLVNIIVARMEAINIFFDFATYMNFKVYQMDVKSTFLNGKLKEEVYVKNPPGFESSEFPDYVCKLNKALYGLKQVPRAWYETLSILLIQNKFTRDDKGILICQEQYTRNLLKKYEISDSSSVKTPMVPPNNLGPILDGKLVNETSYSGMIGSLMYLTATRSDIQFFTVLCARYQSNPKESHPTTMKRILMYLKGTLILGLYYPKCSSFDLKGYSDSNYAGCNMDIKSSSGACQILGGKLVRWSAKK
uniref:Retrovirus-related Pol polyprotein from transposon TNT 1-94 n=1 Tax=Tanacetum cinerariifolium TaxID=118510 RepID=A0A699H053_TANCI|nr:retrovirus-related Pol polyprotein from transposon TNT 1-94 [Tanacetum cinerariifolium]